MRARSAAPTVPLDKKTAAPTFSPIFTPLTTRSGGSGESECTPRFTLSAGVPETSTDSMPDSATRRVVTVSKREIALPIQLRSVILGLRLRLRGGRPHGEAGVVGHGSDVLCCYTASQAAPSSVATWPTAAQACARADGEPDRS